jgi:DNA-binding NarL/FixJ family response regulator
MKRMFIVGKDAFLVTTMRVALRYSAEVTVFGVRDGDTNVRRALQEARPDIVLLDGSAPADRTLDRLAQVAEERPDAIVLVLATGVDAPVLEQLLEAGATVCLSRAVTAGQLELLLAEAGQGEAIQAAPAVAEPAVAARAAEPCPLTNRELEILRCVAEGHTNARIGRDLWVTEQTVKFHLSNIYRKLGVTNRTEASRYMLLNQHLMPPTPAAVPAALTTTAPLQVNGHVNGTARRNGSASPVGR